MDDATREPLRISPFPEDLQAWQGVRLSLRLARPKPKSDLEQVYAAGLAAVARDEFDSGLTHLTTVVERDAQWAYSSARLLVFVLRRAMGDISPLTAMEDALMADGKPDDFAQHAVAECDLRISRYRDDPEPLPLDHMLLLPALATQLANAGSLLVADDFAAACPPLASAMELASTPLCAPWQARSADERDAEMARRSLIEELSQILCLRYIGNDEPDAALDVLGRASFSSDVYLKAEALAGKGLTDAALIAYDDAIKVGKKRGMMYQFNARYDKAKLLIAVGQLGRARKELARLYADQPTYDDKAGLLDAVKPATRTNSRPTIPEDVRHAVWRRDRGRCAQCDSQEDLEFDHIIPVSRGGANTERNLQLLCEHCNREKSATI